MLNLNTHCYTSTSIPQHWVGDCFALFLQRWENVVEGVKARKKIYRPSLLRQSIAILLQCITRCYASLFACCPSACHFFLAFFFTFCLWNKPHWLNKQGQCPAIHFFLLLSFMKYVAFKQASQSKMNVVLNDQKAMMSASSVADLFSSSSSSIISSSSSLWSASMVAITWAGLRGWRNNEELHCTQKWNANTCSLNAELFQWEARNQRTPHGQALVGYQEKKKWRKSLEIRSFSCKLAIVQSLMETVYDSIQKLRHSSFCITYTKKKKITRCYS